MIEEENSRGADSAPVNLLKERIRELRVEEGDVLVKIIKISQDEREVGKAFEDWEPTIREQ